jgi:hypothetical protein
MCGLLEGDEGDWGEKRERSWPGVIRPFTSMFRESVFASASGEL